MAGQEESLGRVMDRPRATVGVMRVGHAVLFEIDRKEAHVKPRKSFDSRMEDNPCTVQIRIPYVRMFIRRTGREERTERSSIGTTGPAGTSWAGSMVSPQDGTGFDGARLSAKRVG